MPQLNLPIGSVTRHIIQPVAEQTTRKILHFLNFDTIFKNNLYFNSYIQQADKFTPDGGEVSKKNKVKLTTDDRATITITPELNPFNIEHPTEVPSEIHTKMMTPKISEEPIFWDHIHDIGIGVKTVSYGIKLGIELRTSSIRTSDFIYSTLSNQLGYKEFAIYQDLVYDVPMDAKMIWFLWKMYELMDDASITTDNLNFFQYLEKYSASTIEMLFNRNKEENRWINLRFSNTQVVGFFKFTGDQPDVEEQDKYAKTYTFKFEYYLQFSAPNSIKMIYPTVINNKYVDPLIIKTVTNEMINWDVGIKFPEPTMNRFIYTTQKPIIPKYPPSLIYPASDDWVPSCVPHLGNKNTYTLFQGIITVEYDTDNDIYFASFDFLNELFPILDEYSLTDTKKAINEFITPDNLRDIHSCTCPILMHIFRNHQLVEILEDVDLIKTDTEYKIRYEAEHLAITDIVRIVFSINLCWSRTNVSHINTMMNEHINTFQQVLEDNFETLVHDGVIIVDEEATKERNDSETVYTLNPYGPYRNIKSGLSPGLGINKFFYKFKVMR